MLIPVFQNYEEIVPCDDGWIFDKSIFGSSAVMEWELVCNKKELRNIREHQIRFHSCDWSFVTNPMFQLVHKFMSKIGPLHNLLSW